MGFVSMPFDRTEDNLPPWLVDVELNAQPQDVEYEVQCAGILKDGSRCTRIYTKKSKPAISYCYKHKIQMKSSTHGYAPLAQSALQVPEGSNPRSSCQCSLHWTYQSICAFFCLFFAIGLLFTSMILKVPHLILASGILFCIPMIVLLNCMARMMLVVLLPIQEKQSHSSVQAA